VDGSETPRAASLRGQIVALRKKLTEALRALTRLHTEGESPAIAPFVSQLRGLQESISHLDKVLAAQDDERTSLAALAEVAGIINSSLRLREVLNRVMDQIIRLTGAERAFLMLWDEKTDQLEFQAARNLDRETITGSAFEISRSVVHRVASEGEPVLTTNAQLDPRFSEQDSVISYNLRSILCVPLRVRDRVIGAVYTDNRVRTGIFSDEDLELLTAFADQAAIAIENARLFGNVTSAKTLMDNVLASITSGVITIDEEATITLFNRAAERILGVSAQEAEGCQCRVVLPELVSMLELLMRRVQREGRPLVGREMELELPKRGRSILSFSVSPLEAPEGKRSGLALVFEDVTERRQLEALQRYVSPTVVQRLREDPGRLRLGGHRQEVTVLFADIRGFTSFSERRDPEQIVEVLNHYLAIGAESVLVEEGTLDKFMGDAVMAIFNAPLPQPDHAMRAVRAALQMRTAIERHHSSVPFDSWLNFGIGIATGEAVVGSIGTTRQLNYTAIGSSVNVAHRLEEAADAGQILLERRAFERVSDLVEANPLPSTKVKGLSAPIQIYELVGLR
jgi:PAS domain S-box-containing protein